MSSRRDRFIYRVGLNVDGRTKMFCEGRTAQPNPTSNSRVLSWKLFLFLSSVSFSFPPSFYPVSVHLSILIKCRVKWMEKIWAPSITWLSECARTRALKTSKSRNSKASPTDSIPKEHNLKNKRLDLNSVRLVAVALQTASALATVCPSLWFRSGQSSCHPHAFSVPHNRAW